MKTLHEIAEENNLEIIDLTTGTNGYPSGTYYGIDATSFNTFKEVEEFADKNDLEIINIHRKNGWHFWESKGTCYKPYEITSDVYGDNYSQIEKIDEEDFINEEVKPLIEAADTFEEIEAIISGKKEIWEQVELIDEDEIVITHEGNYYQTMKKITLSFSEDTHNYSIAFVEN